MRCYLKRRYPIQWAGYNHIRTSWEPAEHLESSWDLVHQFHQWGPDRPQELQYRVQGWRYGGHGSSLDVPFVSMFLHSLLFSLIGSRPGINCVDMGFTTYQWSCSFPMCRMHSKVSIAQYWLDLGLMGLYDCVDRAIVLSVLSHFFVLLHTGFGSPGGLRLKWGRM